MPEYNGHRNRNFWNVALWLHNDEALYEMSLAAIGVSHNREEAARRVLETLHSLGKTQTPDGVTYTKTSILAALRGINDGES